ncbi:MAG: tyrosine-type recombinase/integrase [Schwartzia sp. (in: firmicutes)]
MAFIRKRGKKWYYTIEIGSGENRKRVERPGGFTKAEAEKAWRAAMVEMDHTGQYHPPTEMTVDQFFASWFSDCIDHQARMNTARSYHSLYKTHIQPALGDMKLRLITARRLQNLLTYCKAAGRARSTVSSVAAVLKLAFSYAVNFCEVLPTNPAEKIRVPKYNEPPTRVLTFSREQMTRIKEKFPPGHVFFLPIMFSYHLGVRIGEALAVRWPDILPRSVTICATSVSAPGGAMIQPIPKSKSSFRDLPYGEKFDKLLRAAKIEQAKHKLSYGEFYHDNDLVCCRPDGSLLGPDDLRYFNRWVRETFGAGFSFHSLRHTHATALLEAGEDLEIVSKRLGHASLNITASTYSHVLEKRQSALVHRLDQVL